MIDDLTRECLTLVADTSISGMRVARELDTATRLYGKPRTIVSDNVLRHEREGRLGQAASAVNR